MTDTDRYAAIESHGWLTLLEQCRDGLGTKCERCNNGKWKKWDSYADRFVWLVCGICSGSGHALPPDLVEVCRYFADWLEDHGDPRAEVVRPDKDSDWEWITRIASDRANRRDPTWIADQLLMLFRRPCDGCAGSGRIRCDNPHHGSDCKFDCPDCSGRGYLPLPVPDQRTRV